MSLVYLASPYSADTEAEKYERYAIVCRKAAELMKNGLNVFCPIAHSHPIDKIGKLDVDGVFWLKQDFAILEKCSDLYVYKMPGWDKSYGVFAEMAYAAHKNIPVQFLEYI